MTAPLLSAVLIVRDEEELLPACLDSLDGLADEVIVLDTGSTDATEAVAAAAGARVFHAAWTDDFSAARNTAVDHAAGEWILWVDADERVTAVDHERLRTVLRQSRFVGGTVLFRPSTGTTRYRELRLFRNDPRLRFTGQIHEDVWSATQALAREEGRFIAALDLAIDHLGYEGDQLAKHRRNLPLLQARLRDEPDNVFCLRHLGVVLSALGDSDGAVQSWERALAIGQPAEADPSDWFVYQDLLLHHSRVGLPTDVLLDRAQRRFGDVAPLRSLRADLRMAAGNYGAAVPDLEALVTIEADDVVGRFAFDRRLCGDISWARLGICRFQSGAYDEAAAAFEAANRLHPSTEYQTRLTVARARAGVAPAVSR